MEYPDPGINGREAVIPGLLCEKPLYGYTLEKIIEGRGMRCWTAIGFSSLSFMLKRPERSRNMIVSPCKQQENKPSRKVYAITRGGEHQMKENVRSLSQNQRIASPFDQGVAHLQLLSTTGTIACLNERIKALDNAIELIKAHRISHEEIEKPHGILALFDRALTHLCPEKGRGEKIQREGESACPIRFSSMIR